MKSVLAVLLMSSLASGMSFYDADSPTIETYECSFMRIAKTLVKCQNQFHEEDDDLINNPLAIAKGICSNRYSIEKCFKENLVECSNKEDAINGLTLSLTKCNGAAVKEPLSRYFEVEYMPIGGECLYETIITTVIPCIRGLEPAQGVGNMTYKQGVDLLNSVLSNMQQCFGNLIDEPALGHCDGRSGSELLLNSLAIFTVPNILGVDAYTFFIEKQNAKDTEEIQQIIGARALRDLLRW